MRLLICTQAIDRGDPVLGFFHGWVAALAEHAESVEIICLKKGDYALSVQVQVHSLGKEKVRVSKLRYSFRFLKLTWQLRKNYDTVFVHMNEEYVLLGGVLWRLFGKKVVLWRNHKVGHLSTRFACRLSHTVCYTSPEAFVARYSKAVQMPVGIDTGLFTPARELPDLKSVLFLGRLDPVKNPEVFLNAVAELERKGVDIAAHVYGDPTPGRESYAVQLKERYGHLKSVTFFPGVTHNKTPELYQTHAVYVNTTPSGSFDKTIGEAMASGTAVVAANAAVKDIVGQKLFVADNSPHALAEALEYALSRSDRERTEIGARSRAWVIGYHSFDNLLRHLMLVLTAT